MHHCQGLFDRGFSSLLHSGAYCDVVLVARGGESYRAHRLVLAHGSDYFRKLFSEGDQTPSPLIDASNAGGVGSPLVATRPSKQDGSTDSALDRWTASNDPIEVPLPLEDHDRLFPDVLRFLYGDDVTVSLGSVIPLLSLANELRIKSLQLLCIRFLRSSTTRTNALSLLHQAVRYETDDVISTCVDVIARNFAYIYDADYTSLPHDVFQLILDHPDLSVLSHGEYELYQLVCDYIASKDKLMEEHAQHLLASVRYRWMSTDEILLVKANPMVNAEILVDALLANAREASGEELKYQPDDLKSRRLMPREDFGITFEYSGDWDNEGILYWISTCGKRREWCNPHTSGEVIVSSSSLAKGEKSRLVELVGAELWSDDVPASWMSIDVGPCREVSPNYYTLRHGGNHSGDALRSWDLQGSPNGKTWTLLRRHTNDMSLSGPFSSCSWAIECSQAFRHFRVLMTGHNSNRNNFLLLSGIELYGRLKATGMRTSAGQVSTRRAS